MNDKNFENKSFEENLMELEKIISLMEKSDISLDDAIILYEKGLNLSIYLNNLLTKYEGKIKILDKNFEEGKISNIAANDNRIENSSEAIDDFNDLDKKKENEKEKSNLKNSKKPRYKKEAEADDSEMFEGKNQILNNNSSVDKVNDDNQQLFS